MTVSRLTAAYALLALLLPAGLLAQDCTRCEQAKKETHKATREIAIQRDGTEGRVLHLRKSGATEERTRARIETKTTDIPPVVVNGEDGRITVHAIEGAEGKNLAATIIVTGDEDEPRIQELEEEILTFMDGAPFAIEMPLPGPPQGPGCDCCCCKGKKKAGARRGPRGPGMRGMMRRMMRGGGPGPMMGRMGQAMRNKDIEVYVDGKLVWSNHGPRRGMGPGCGKGPGHARGPHKRGGPGHVKELRRHGDQRPGHGMGVFRGEKGPGHGMRKARQKKDKPLCEDCARKKGARKAPRDHGRKRHAISLGGPPSKPKAKAAPRPIKRKARAPAKKRSDGPASALREVRKELRELRRMIGALRKKMAALDARQRRDI